jgi:hypothetical protein
MYIICPQLIRTYNSHSLLHLPSIGVGEPCLVGVKISRESTDDLLAKMVTAYKKILIIVILHEYTCMFSPSKIQGITGGIQ